MIIRQFNDSDVPQACKLAQLTWGDFYTNESQQLQSFIYDLMVKYYDLNRNYSFSIINNGLKGFLLGFQKSDYNKFFNFDEEIKILTNKSEQKTAQELFNYLEKCGGIIKDIINDDDIILGLFVSIRKGCGKKLLFELIQTCRKNGIKNIYLWTDTTCDYDYYNKNNFTLEKEIETFINSKTIKTLIFKRSI